MDRRKRRSRLDRDQVAYTLVAVFGVLVTWLFVLFWLHGHLKVWEDNLFVRGLETALGPGLIAFGAHGLVRKIRGRWR